MKKISSSLQGMINDAGPNAETSFKLIVILRENSDWEEGVRLIQEAGLQVESMAKEIRFVSGKAKAADIHRIAEVSAVESVEPDEQASAMG